MLISGRSIRSLLLHGSQSVAKPYETILVVWMFGLFHFLFSVMMIRIVLEAEPVFVVGTNSNLIRITQLAYFGLKVDRFVVVHDKDVDRVGRGFGRIRQDLVVALQDLDLFLLPSMRANQEALFFVRGNRQ